MLDGILDGMSNHIIEVKISKGKLTDEDYDNYDFKFKAIVTSTVTTLLVFSLGYILKCFFEVFIIGFIFNFLKYYSIGYHFSTIEKCTSFSIAYTIILSIISKYTVHYTPYNFFICILLFIFTLKSVPNIPIEDKEKSDKFYIMTYTILFLLFLIIDVICIYIDSSISLLIANSISFGIISVELFLTKTGFKIFKLLDKI